MKNESKALREIHAIRETHYENTKDMKPSALINQINEEGKEMQRLIEKAKKECAS